MTFSIVAYSSAEESWGVAVATRYLAVGAIVPAAEFGAGALATQARTNMAYREAGLSMLRTGMGAKDVIAALISRDDRSEERQVGVVDRSGVAATWTGGDCVPFAGGCVGDGYAIQGNMLQGAKVIEAMEQAWLTSDSSLPLADRLIVSLSAGDAAGGDHRGRQSAALYVVSARGGIGDGSNVGVDLRVDDARRPISELSRLWRLRQELPDIS